MADWESANRNHGKVLFTGTIVRMRCSALLARTEEVVSGFLCKKHMKEPGRTVCDVRETYERQ